MRNSTLFIIVFTLWTTSSYINRSQGAAFLDKELDTDIRVVSYNIWANSIGDPGSLQDRFARVVEALDPDILNLQEISNPDFVRSLMNTISPLPGGASWHTYLRTDNMIVSKYPLQMESRFGFGAASALVDLPDSQYEQDLFVINDHWPCCSFELGRQREADFMVRELKALREPDSGLAPGTPLLVVGDLNIVQSGRPLETILTGDILDNFVYGEDSPPDWDGTPLANALPLHNGRGPENWTWRNDDDVFDPGILDFILYSDSVVSTANQFTLDTTTMTAEELTSSGLQQYDVVINEQIGFYDHLPVVVDFRVATVPEPQSAMLLFFGLCGLMGWHKKRPC